MIATPENYAKFVREVREKHTADAFYSLFDGGGTFDGAFKHAMKTFNSMFLPFAQKYLGVNDLEDKTSLDIGYGSGLQVATARFYFGKAIGIDVHTEGDYIYDDFIHRGFVQMEKMDLIASEANAIYRVEDSVDFVHSWVTFLHFPSIEYVSQSLKEIYRVLKPGGIAVIYYPRLVKTKRKETPAEYEIDLKSEDLHEKGFEEKGSLTEVFKAGIIIARWKMAELVESVGFEVLEHTCSNDGGFIFGQHGIVIRKPPVIEVETSTTSPSTEILYTTPSKPEKKKRLISRKKKSIKKT